MILIRGWKLRRLRRLWRFKTHGRKRDKGVRKAARDASRRLVNALCCAGRIWEIMAVTAVKGGAGLDRL